jgi:hypothetical protein
VVIALRAWAMQLSRPGCAGFVPGRQADAHLAFRPATRGWPPPHMGCSLGPD